MPLHLLRSRHCTARHSFPKRCPRPHLLRVAHHRRGRPHRFRHDALGLLGGRLLRRGGSRRCRRQRRSAGGGGLRSADGLGLDALACRRRRRSRSTSSRLLRLLHRAAGGSGRGAGRCGGGRARSRLVHRGWRLRGGSGSRLGGTRRRRPPRCRRRHGQRLARALRRRHALGNVRRQLVQRQWGAQLPRLKRGDAAGREAGRRRRARTRETAAWQQRPACGAAGTLRPALFRSRLLLPPTDNSSHSSAGPTAVPAPQHCQPTASKRRARLQ